MKKNKIPKPNAICGKCTRPIYLKNEVGGHLHISGGKPICIICRVLLGKTKGSKKVIEKRNSIKEVQQQGANEQAKDFAIRLMDNPKVAEVSIANHRKLKGKNK